jgi:hypothetical protein
MAEARTDIEMRRAKTIARENYPLRKLKSSRTAQGNGFVGAVAWPSTAQHTPETIRPRFGRGRYDYFLARAFLAFFAFFAFLAIAALSLVLTRNAQSRIYL